MRAEGKTMQTAEKDIFIAERVSFGSVNNICFFSNAMDWFVIEARVAVKGCKFSKLHRHINVSLLNTQQFSHPHSEL